MKHLLLFTFFALSAFAEQHFYILKPLPAKVIQDSGLPDYLTATAKDVLMVNVRLQRPGEAYRLRVWYTVKRPNGVEVTYPAEALVRSEDLWASVAFVEFAILESEFVRIRFKEEPEPVALAESTTEVQR